MDNKWDFKTLEEALRTGREIEFTFRGKNYSITNTNQQWILCCDTDEKILSKLCAYSEMDLLIKKISIFKIDGIYIPDIFNNSLYQENSICIL